MPDNTVTLVGNITRDPELRFTPSGQSVASFGLAVNRRWQDRGSGQWQEQTSFIDVKCWSQMAENVAESLARGARVIVTGRLEQRSWETEQGDKRSEVKKNERREGGNTGGGYDNQGGGQSRPAASSGGGGGSYADDEEPF
jgi:single-strand DNA-binding protein